MKLDKKLTQALIAGLGLYLLLSSPLETALVTFGIAAIIFGITQQLELAVAVLAAPIIIKLVNTVNEPFKVNGESIAKRLEEVKLPAPLKPKVDGPTGVLESAKILDSESLVGMKRLADEALPGCSIPASAKASVAIYVPEEASVKPLGTRVTEPMSNPVLQNGPDNEGVNTALASNGAMSNNAASNSELLASNGEMANANNSEQVASNGEMANADNGTE